MPLEKKCFALMFADVSGSSRLYKEFGDSEAKSTIDVVITMMKEITARNNGDVIKTIGDEIMARFKSCEDAALAAIQMQQNCRSQDTGHAVRLRIGLDYGDVLIDKGDLFGDTVNSAAYVSHVAQAEQIVLTANVMEQLGNKLKTSCHEFDKVTVKGAQGKTMLYHLIWEAVNESNHTVRTQFAELPDITKKMGVKLLKLRYQNKNIEINFNSTPFTIGRSQTKSSLYVSSSLASRDHCHVIYRRGKFVLVDHSTNGTYVAQNGQKKIYLRREELPLVGHGEIIIGQADTSSENDLIHYSLD